MGWGLVVLVSDAQEQGQGTGSLWDVVKADLRAAVIGDGAGPMSGSKVLASVLLLPRVRALVMLRLGQWLARRGLRVPAIAIQGWTQRVSGADINPWASIGPGLCLAHSVGIVVGPEVKVGSAALLYQNVTLGDGSRPGQPTVGDYVTIGAGASVLGGVTVGDGAVIGAGAVVTTDVPAGMVATGVPAVVTGPVGGGWARVPRRPRP